MAWWVVLIPGTLTFLLFGVTAGVLLMWFPGRARRFGLVLLTALHATPPLWLPLTIQWKWTNVFHFLVSSPIPLFLGAILLLLPIALVLRAVLDAQRPGESLHLARMAGSRRLVWELLSALRSDGVIA